VEVTGVAILIYSSGRDIPRI